MVSIATFNNKGGVGKTTLTNNIASFIAKDYSARVLVVDCDPQCNSTQLLLGQENAFKLYWSNDKNLSCTTIGEILRPIQDGDSSIAAEITPIDKSLTRFGVDLIPGDPKFSMIEDMLGAAWHALKGGNIGGIRQTSWNYFLTNKLKDNYDYIFYDLGPSLGSINRSVLIGCDYFVTPMGTDIFSILGIKNIAEWIKTWINSYKIGIQNCERADPGKLGDYGIPTDLNILHGYIGYTMQQYITKSFKGERRPTKSYDEIINQVPAEVENSLGDFFKPGLTREDLRLGDVPHLYSLIPLAQTNAAPLHGLKGGDGLVGSQFRQLEEYKTILGNIVGKLVANAKNDHVA